MSEFDTQLAALTAANGSLQTAIGKMNNLMTASETTDVTIEGQVKPSVAKQVKTKTDPAVNALNSATTAQNTATAALNSLMTASETTDVTIGGAAVPSVAKQIKTKADASFGAIVGAKWRLAYKTKAEMAAASVPNETVSAEVWSDTSLSNNGVYVRSGGAWVKDANSPITINAAKNDITATRLCIQSPKFTEGGALGGAQYFDGTTTVGASPSSGGWKIPAGATGASTYNRYKFAFTAAESAAKAGRAYRFSVLLKTTASLLAALTAGVTVACASVGASGAISNVTHYQSSPNFITIQFDYFFVGTETQINCYMQVNGANPVQSSDVWCVVYGQYYVAVDVGGSNDALLFATSGLQAVVDGATLSFDPPPKSQIVVSPSLYNGATINSTATGVIIPAGATGISTYVIYMLPLGVLSAAHPGATVKIKLILATSDNLIGGSYSGAGAGVNGNYGGSQQVVNSVTVTQSSPNVVTVIGDYVLKGHADESMGLYLQVAGTASNTATERYFDLVTSDYQLVSLASTDTASRNDVALRQVTGLLEDRYKQYVAAALSGGGYASVVTVKKSGGDYSSLPAACAAIGDGTAMGRKLILMYPGVYTETDALVPNYVDVVGVGRIGEVWLKGELPNNAAPAAIVATQTIWLNKTSKIKNLRITAKNLRYPIHSDSGASQNKATLEIEDCIVENFGNQGAIDYWQANGGVSVWSIEHAFGCGTHSGQQIYIRRSKFTSRTSPFFFHTNRDFIDPCYVEVVDSEFDCTTETGVAISVQSCGTGKRDRLVVRNTMINGLISAADSWLSTATAEAQPANRNEIEVTVSGCGAAAWTAIASVDALELRSSDGASSSVAVSGDAALLLFGASPDIRVGSVGYAARMYSWHTITTSLTGCSLASRLGNLAAAPKTLNIVFDGSVNATITLNADYSAMANAAVVAWLNTALADAARGFYISQPYNYRLPIALPEYDLIVKNTGTTAILKGGVAAMAGGYNRGRLMTSADDARLLIGIAVEDIPVGQRGKVTKTSMTAGLIRQSGLVATAGATAEIGATAGVLVPGSTKPLYRCVDSQFGVWEPL